MPDGFRARETHRGAAPGLLGGDGKELLQKTVAALSPTIPGRAGLFEIAAGSMLVSSSHTVTCGDNQGLTHAGLMHQSRRPPPRAAPPGMARRSRTSRGAVFVIHAK